MDLFRFPTISALAAHLGATAPEIADLDERRRRAELRRERSTQLRRQRTKGSNDDSV
jgi:hypothetical protein